MILEISARRRRAIPLLLARLRVLSRSIGRDMTCYHTYT